MANASTQKTNNYFTINIQKYGDNFVAQKAAQDIQRDARKKIFKDIVFGNIDYDAYGQYFTDATFLDNLITVAMTEKDIHEVTGDALSKYALQYPQDPRSPLAMQKAAQHKNTGAALSVLLGAFLTIKNTNMNISCLPSITTAVYPFKRDFAEFY
jgi:hypothetical protein